MADRNPDQETFGLPSAVARIDAACDRFEADWKAGRRPRLEDFLKRCRSDLEGAMFEELLAVECELRRLAGESPCPGDYLERLPAFRPQIERAFCGLHGRPQPATTAGRHAVTADGALATNRIEVVDGALRVRCPSCHAPIDVDERPGSMDVTCAACGSHFNLLSDASTEAYKPGPVKTLGNFELLEQVGSGRFGVVWKARDRKLQRIVALKVPRRSQIDCSSLEDLMREARAAAQISHPGIVSIYEVGCVEDTPYIACEFVEGVSLQEWLTGQRLTPSEAAGLCLKIADALQAAHQAGVVHRDLKPGNIMIDRDGEPHVADFGLAKREAGEVTVTMDGQILGTPAYMSPEQARGESHHADTRTDVYSLGVVFYELLTGELPFRGDVRMILHQVKYEEPASPRKLASRIPRDLESVCLKCLEKSPGRRYETAGELADDLRRFLAGQPVRAVPVGTLGRIWRWYSRNPASAHYAAAGYTTGAAGLAAVWTVFGIVSIWMAYVPAQNPSQLLLHIVLLLLFIYLPGLWLGVRALNGWKAALWLSTAGWFSAMVFAVSGYLGLAFDVVTYGDTATRRPLFSLLCLLCLIGLMLQFVAVTSQLIANSAETRRKKPGKIT